MNKAELVWFTGASEPQKEAALRQLHSYDIVAR